MRDWKQDLTEFFKEKEHRDQKALVAFERYASAASKFYETTINPSLEAFKSELERHARRVIFSPSGELRQGHVHSSIMVFFEDRLEFGYTLRADISSSGIRVGKEITSIDEKTGKLHVEDTFTVNGCVVATEEIIRDKISEEQIIRQIIEDYKPHALSHPLRPKTSIEEAFDHDDAGDDDSDFDFLFD
jgi:hypothetical protein